jgi:hypothetical protein
MQLYCLGLIAFVAGVCVAPAPAWASSLLLNGGFEAGLAGWTVVDESGSSGTWFAQSSTLSPISGFGVPAPPEGTTAAMTDQANPGSHVLYQDFVVPLTVTVATLQFEYFIQNLNGAFITPASLDFLAGQNQQARVDIMTTTADPFSVAPGDVLFNVYQTLVGDPAVSGYSLISVDLTALLQSHLGETLRLRFAEVDNQFFFQNGVDAATLDVNAAVAVPEPATLTLVGLGLGAAWRRRRTSR